MLCCVVYVYIDRMLKAEMLASSSIQSDWILGLFLFLIKEMASLVCLLLYFELLNFEIRSNQYKLSYTDRYT